MLRCMIKHRNRDSDEILITPHNPKSRLWIAKESMSVCKDTTRPTKGTLHNYDLEFAWAVKFK
jgi:hypothetical protein